MIKIASWNIRQGGGSRISKIFSALQKKKLDIITLNEYRNNKSGEKIRARFLEMGYRHQMVTDAKTDVNSVIIASKIPFEGLLFPSSDPEYGHNIVGASFSAFDLYGVYFPHKKKHRLFDFFQGHLAVNKVSIIAGDFNSGINGVDQRGKSFWYEDELIALGKIGYLDAFRFKNGDVEEYSWYSHQGNGYRYDHTYIHSDLSPICTSCKYDHEVRQNGISDHSMMIIELG